MKKLTLFFIVLPCFAWADAGIFADRELDQGRLSRDLVAAGLTCRTGQTNRVVEDGKAVLETVLGELLIRALDASGRKILLDSNGAEVHPSDARPRTTARYIWLDCDQVIDRAAVQGVLDSHDVSPMWRDRRKQSGRRYAKGKLEKAFEDVDIVLMRSIRDARNTLAGQIDAMTLAQLKAFDVRTWAGWP